jgi:hypothetical protein
VEILRQVIDLDLTTKQIQQICEGEATEAATATNEEALSKQAIKVARALRGSTETTAYELAHALIHQERSVPLAKARIQTLRRLLDDADDLLSRE